MPDARQDPGKPGPRTGSPPVPSAFPRTPINIEIEGRRKAEKTAAYVKNARVLGALPKATKRTDLVVASFEQAAGDRFHKLAPKISVAPGIDGMIRWAFQNGSPGEGVQTFGVPMTYKFGDTTIQTAEYIDEAYADGYAWHAWVDDDVDGRESWAKLNELCADGIMTSTPVRLEAWLKTNPRPAACT